MKRYDAVLFDLDGTLSASADGIRQCIELTMKELRRPCPDLSDYTRYVGPPLDRTFERLCGLTREEALGALPIYRSYYRIHGVRANRLYDGVGEVLSALRTRGCLLAVCSSKNERLAREVTDLLGVTRCFDAVCGSRDDGSRKDKVSLIPYALASLGDVSPARAVMVGDTRFDAEGAFRCGVDFVGVTYGYGTEESMRLVGAERFAAAPAELLELL